jgi:hypothetical protein
MRLAPTDPRSGFALIWEFDKIYASSIAGCILVVVGYRGLPALTDMTGI